MSTRGALRTVLDALVARLGAELELKTAEVWDGPWQALDDPGRVSVAMPAAYVSLAALDVDHRARARYHPGQLRAATGGDPANEHPAPGQRTVAGAPTRSTPAAPHARAALAVTFLAADPLAADRAGAVVDLAEAAVPVLVGFACRDIRGSSLYTAALYRKGLAAFVVTGQRTVELGAGPPARTPPEQVDLVDAAGVRETVWVRGAA